VQWGLLGAFVVLLAVGVVRVWRSPHLPPGVYPTVNNRRVQRRRR
jgi:hypothetical protein